MTTTLMPPREIARTRQDHADNSIDQTVTFDRDVTVEEFTEWLVRHGWLGFDPHAYGPVRIWTARNVGYYRHWRYSGD